MVPVMIAYSYLRFSNLEQSSGDSFRRQTEASEKYASEHGLILDKTLKLHDLGLSAFDKTNVIRGQLGGFLKAIEAGRVAVGSYLLVESLDRLSRAQVLDALQQFIAILNSGVVIVTLSDNQVYSKESVGTNFSQLLISITIMQRAHEESMMKSKRIGAAWEKKYERLIATGEILTKNTPAWIRVVDGKFELIQDRVEVIHRILKSMRDGLGQNTIVKLLNKDTVGWNKQGNWNPSYLIKLAHSISLYGAFDAKGTIVEGYYPAIISKEEYFYLQSLIVSRRPHDKVGSRKGKVIANLFSGLVHCGYCGSKIVYSRNNDQPTNKRNSYLYCFGARTGQTDCKCIGWPYKEFEESFLFQLTNLDFSTVLGVQKTDKADELERQFINVTGKIEELERKIANLYIAIEEDPLPGLVKRIKAFELELEDLTKQKSNLSNQLTSEKMSMAGGKSRMHDLISFFKMLKKTTDPTELLAVRESLYQQIRTLIEKIDMYPTGPSLNKENREMRFLKVLFKSGTVVEIS